MGIYHTKYYSLFYAEYEIIFGVEIYKLSILSFSKSLDCLSGVSILDHFFFASLLISVANLLIDLRIDLYGANIVCPIMYDFDDRTILSPS